MADRLGLIPPSVEQPEYNLLERRKASSTLSRLCQAIAAVFQMAVILLSNFHDYVRLTKHFLRVFMILPDLYQ